ncbi:MAG: 5-formyltetrahydrofolate cyclo-ligase [Candidatus Undinarchaeales archaeon]
MKHKLRKEQKKTRDGMDKKERYEKSREIKEKLFEMHEFKEAETVLFYSSIKSEVETEEMIKGALKLNKKIALPITNSLFRTLKAFELKDYSELEPGTFGVPEPKQKNELVKKDIDLVLVPGVVFDLNGHRIGYGEGYYDNFLSKMKDTPKFGLSFEVQIVEEIPAEPHDVKLNKIITEKRIINCDEKS